MSSSPPSSSPSQAYGRYSLLEKIGQGGMAEVFRAKSYGVEGFEKVLVIKRLLTQLAKQGRFVEMFVREAKLAVRLSHANVVQVFDLGRVGESVFIAMEYVHGVDLSTLLSWSRRRNVPLSPATAAYIAAEIAKGLDHAHRRRDEQLRPLGIVHRDVSPQNVLLSYEGEVKVTDFGIAKARDSLGTTTDDDGPRSDGKIAIRGKYAYLAPEQANGEEVDARADIWALGVVLYEMIAGSNPFAAPTTFETLRRVRAAEAPPIELARPDVPAELATIVRKALALSPLDRYPDAARLHDDLLAYLYTSGERFGGHALGELLSEMRASKNAHTRDLVPSPEALFGRQTAEEPDASNVEGGLAKTPVEVPETSEVPTIPPRPMTSTAAPVSSDHTPTGLVRAASLGEHREVTALVLEVGGLIEVDIDLDPFATPSIVPNPDSTMQTAAASMPSSVNAVSSRPRAGSIVPASKGDGKTLVNVDAAALRESLATVPPPRMSSPPARLSAPPPSLERTAAESHAFLRRYGAEVIDDEPGRVTALFGTRVLDGRDTDIAIRCALGLVRLVRDDAPTSSIGIHSARVTVQTNGDVVQDERLTKLISGARDLARAREGRISVSSAAYRHVRGTVDVEPLVDIDPALSSLGGMLLRGRKPPSETYAKFVGRREELRVLGEILAAATRRRARIVTVHGAPGVGKTRLLHEIQRRLQRGSYNVGWYLATCAPHGSDVALAGIAAMLRVLCGIEEGDSESKLAAVRPRLRALGLPDDELNAVIELVRTGGDRGRVDEAPEQERISSALARMITRLCDDRLHVLAWDDAQSMDPASAALLAAVGRNVATCRAVLLFSGLPTETVTGTLSSAVVSSSSGDGRPLQQHLLELAELSGEDAPKLVASRLNARTVAPDLLAFISARAGGNPLHIEELVRALLEAGAIAKEVEPADPVTKQPMGERAIGRRLGEGIDLPKSLRGLVASRLSRLSTTERALLTTTALLGQPTEIDLLAASAGEDVGTVERQVDALEAAGVVRHVGERTIAFVSPVVREVVLDAAPIEAKRELHAAIAAALLAAPNPVLGRVGHHLLESGDRERAATYFGQSGEALLIAGRPEEAARDLTRALVTFDLGKRPAAVVAGWLRALTQAVATSRGGRGEGGVDVGSAIERARARISNEADVRMRRDVLLDVGKCYAALSRFDRARLAYDDAELLSAGDERGLRAVLTLRADLATFTFEFGDAIAILERIEPVLARSPSEAKAYYTLLLNLAHAVSANYADAGRERALEYLRLAEIQANRTEDSILLQIEREKIRALVYINTLDFKGGAESSAKAAELARQAGLLYETAVTLHNLAESRARMGENAAAYAAAQQSIALSEEGGHDILVAANKTLVHYLDGVAGHPRAIEALQELIAWSQSRGFEYDEVLNRYWLGRLFIARGEGAKAIPLLERARQTAVRLSTRVDVLACDEAIAAARKLV